MLVAAALAVALGACGAYAPSDDAYARSVRARASAELGCPEAALAAHSMGAGGYVVSGCGRRQTYTCVTQMRGWGFGAHREVVCAPDGVAQASASASAEPEPSATSHQDARIAVAAIASCPPVEEESTVELTIGPAGTATRIETHGIPAATGACYANALQHALYPLRQTAEVVRIRIHAHAASGTASSAPATDPAAEAAARQAIDELRTAILACSSGQPIAVTGEWTTSGALTLHLTGDLAGSAQEGCMRAAASGVVLSPAPTAAGSVLHAVR